MKEQSLLQFYIVLNITFIYKSDLRSGREKYYIIQKEGYSKEDSILYKKKWKDLIVLALN